MMDRRRFLVTSLAGALAVPLAAESQLAATVRRIGVLWVSPLSVRPLIEALAELGHVDGKNVLIDFRQVTPPDLPAQAADLVRLNAAVVVTQGTQATRAAMAATRTTPIVMMGAADPVATGVIASLHHPGGNVTGSTDMRPAVTSKRVQLIKEIAPAVRRLGALFDPREPAVPQEWADTEAAARALGLLPQAMEFRAPEEIAPAFARLMTNKSAMLVVFARISTATHRSRIIALAASNGIPAVYGAASFARHGGLMGLGANYLDLLRRTASLVDKILKGAKPSDLPIEQPTTFELVLNLKTAKALGLTIPPSLLAQADQIIE